MMFWLIFIWFFLLQFVTIFKNTIQKAYWILEQSSILYSQKFVHLGFLEKLFLSFFYRDGLFEHSIANLTDKDSIYDYRQKNFPKIFCYHIFTEKMYFDDYDLEDLIEQYEYLSSSPFFKKYILIKNIFDLHNIKINKKSRYKSNFFFFLILQDVLKYQYFNNIDYLYFDEKCEENVYDYMIFSYILMSGCQKKIYFFNLNYYTDWYKYSFNKDLIKSTKKAIFSPYVIFIKNKLKEQKKHKFILNFYHYYLSYKYNRKLLSYKGGYASSLKKLFNKNNKIIIFDVFKNFFKNLYKIKFKDSSNIKNIKYLNLSNYSFFFLRKNRIFNKGRYSRNRQLYRTGVYWCLWLNIIIVYGLYFLFYRFSFNFGYIWIGMFFLILSTIFSRVSKYNFYNLFFLKNELFFLKNWFYYIWLNFFIFFENLFEFVVYNYVLFFISFFEKKKIFFQKNILSRFFLFFFYNLKKFFITIKKSKRIYIWEIMIEKDDSLLRYKTFFFLIKQVYKSIIF